MKTIKQWARMLKQQLFVLYYAYQDRRAPWHAKLVAICVVAYAFSPIDLIPDFIPVLGYLDDVILVPLGILLAIRLLPEPVLQDSRAKAESWLATKQGKPVNWIAGSLVLLIWVLLIGWLVYWGYDRWVG